jgi:hypothetical protein
MRKRARITPIFAGLLVFALTLSGCGGGVKAFVKSVEEEESLVFGHLDMDEAPTNLDWVSMKRLRPVSKTPYYSFGIDGSMFYRTHTPPGTYKFESFGGSSVLRNADYKFKFPDQGKGEMDRVISSTGLYYVGSYKFKRVKTGFFEQGKFSLEKVDKPSEKELLMKLLEKAQHPSWKAVIQKRIGELR